jgi:parallel beta-helix repeat protein
MVIEMLSEKVGVSKRVLITISTLVLIGFIACGWLSYSFGQSGPTTPFVMSGGVYPGAPSFTVWGEAGTYYAKNQYGVISFSSTNANAAIQYCITNIGNYGKIYLDLQNATITGLNIINTGIVTDQTTQYIEIFGNGFGQTILKGSTSSMGASSIDPTYTQKAWVMIDSYDNSGIKVYLHDFQIDGQHDSNPNIVQGIAVRYGRDALIERVMVQRCSRNGITIIGPNLAYRGITIQDCKVFDITDPNHVPSSPAATYCSGINTEVGVADVFIKNNEIGWIGTNGTNNPPRPWLGNGISLSDSCIAENNVIWATGYGIRTYADTADQIIRDNFVDFSDTVGIFLDQSDQTTVISNTFRNNYQYGIYLANAFNNSVQNNKFILRSGYSAISFINEEGTSDHNSIIDNNCESGTILWEKIHISGSSTLAKNNAGWKIECHVLSPAFSIAGVSIVTVTIPHGLAIVPSPSNTSMQLTLVQDSVVDDWICGYMKVVSSDSTNVYVKVNVVNASATGGATSKIYLSVFSPYSG